MPAEQTEVSSSPTAQAAVEQGFKPLKRNASERTGLKNFTKWRRVPCCGEPILTRGPRGFVPMKLPYDGAPTEDAHNARLLAGQFPTLRRILDLQQQDSAYSCEGTAIVRERIAHESKVVPSRETVARFVAAARAYWAEAATADALLGVHCHYGFNRTGFLLVSFLVEEEEWDVDEAIAAFQQSRAPGIKHEHFKEALRERYTTVGGGSQRKRKQDPCSSGQPPTTATAALMARRAQLLFLASVIIASTSIIAWRGRNGA